MKIIRWLLSHTFLILLIVIVIYGYMFWGNLLGINTPAGKAIAYMSSEFVAVKDFVDAVKAKQAGMDVADSAKHMESSHAGASALTGMADASGGDENSNVDDINAVDQREVVQRKAVIVIESSANEIIVTEKVTDHVEQTQTAPTQAEQLLAAQLQTEQQLVEPSQFESAAQSDPAITVESHQSSENLIADNAVSSGDSVEASASNNNADEASTDQTGTAQQDMSQHDTALADTAHSNIDTSKTSAMDSASNKDAFVPAEIEKQLEGLDRQGKVVDQAQNNDTVRADWITARKSFYQRNYELSEQSYKKVIDQSKDNFDAYGELGNVYFNQGKNKQAASAYYEAAAILVRKGEIVRAKSLLGLLRHLDSSKADGLQALIDSEQS